MKTLLRFMLIGFILFTQTSCFEESDFLWNKKTVVEFQATVVTSLAVGKTYPLLPIKNGAGNQTTQVNLVGPQRSKEEVIKFSVDKDNTTAVEGVHYNLKGGTFTIPANSSLGNCVVEVLNGTPPTSTTTKTVDLVLTLEGNGSDISPNENYKKVGYRISF
ncbi:MULTISPECIES: DUF4843 domain-containing protein [Spirosoma]|uniref:DUF4843 domain-containing protein n=2 Tax=Spirosoma TaxID=107 RepID=A0A6G9ALX4_9BACT|nr:MULTISPECIES: DUF4843 domain-containing protein [Spirosoma]QHV95071.1 DUF4843 domain-containing protein [Spirosoma endbachense]QIP13492.1 DUF4843 domain-containing protein [Spirosoma aureum]